MTVTVHFQRLPGADPAIALPAYATSGSAGADIRANLSPDLRDTGMLLPPMSRIAVPTGLACEIPAGFEMQIRPRSGLALRFGVTLPNTPATIDSDYRGALHVPLINLGQCAFRIEHGARIAQIVIAPVIQARFALTDTLSSTDRGEGGFGSTGTA